MFAQTLNPAGHLWLTVLIALVPMIALIFLLVVFRITAWISTILLGVVTIPLAVLVWHAPLAGTLKSYLYGGLTGFWVIDWITFWGLIIFNTLVLTGRFRAIQELDGASRHRRHSHSNHHAGVGFRRAAGRAGRIRLSVGGGRADSGRPGNRRPGSDSRGRAGEQRSRLLRRAGRSDLGLGCGHRASADGAFRFHRQHRRDSGAAAALGADLSGERLGRNGRGVAAGDRRLAFLHRGPVAGGALPGSLSAGPERRAGFFLGSLPLREDLATPNDSRIWRRVRLDPESSPAADSSQHQVAARSVFGVVSLHRA